MSGTRLCRLVAFGTHSRRQPSGRLWEKQCLQARRSGTGSECRTIASSTPRLAWATTSSGSLQTLRHCDGTLHAPGRRPFSTTLHTHKNRKDHHNPKKHSPRPEEIAIEDTDHTSKQERSAAQKPFDLIDLETAFKKAAEHHAGQLQRQRAGGRFNADELGRLAVRPDKASPTTTYPLSELATVSHQAQHRHVTILAHERAAVKAIISAVQASPDFNQQPQRSEDNELELTVRIEAETPERLVARVKETCLAWRNQVRQERLARRKMHDKWAKANMIRADDKTRLDKEVEKMVEKELKVIDDKEKEALKLIQKGR